MLTEPVDKDGMADEVFQGVMEDMREAKLNELQWTALKQLCDARLNWVKEQYVRSIRFKLTPGVKIKWTTRNRVRFGVVVQRGRQRAKVEESVTGKAYRVPFHAIELDESS